MRMVRSTVIVVAVLAFASSVAADDRTVHMTDGIPECGLYDYAAEITRVIDGDTVVANIDLGFTIWVHDLRLRLYGIDTPEDGEVGADAATNALRDRIEGEAVHICTTLTPRSREEARDGFGRYLATIFFESENINDWMMREGYAVMYGE